MPTARGLDVCMTLLYGMLYPCTDEAGLVGERRRLAMSLAANCAGLGFFVANWFIKDEQPHQGPANELRRGKDEVLSLLLEAGCLLRKGSVTK